MAFDIRQQARRLIVTTMTIADRAYVHARRLVMPQNNIQHGVAPAARKTGTFPSYGFFGWRIFGAGLLVVLQRTF
jgi:hypothetical protein